MPRKLLTAEQYAAGIEELTTEDIMRHGSKIVSSPVALVLLSQRAGKSLDRNIIIQKCRRGQLRPMGRYGGKTLYFWKRDIDQLHLGYPKKAK